MKALVVSLYEYLITLPVATAYPPAQSIIEPRTSLEIAHNNVLHAIWRDDAAGSSSITRAEDLQLKMTNN